MFSKPAGYKLKINERAKRTNLFYSVEKDRSMTVEEDYNESWSSSRR